MLGQQQEQHQGLAACASFSMLMLSTKSACWSLCMHMQAHAFRDASAFPAFPPSLSLYYFFEFILYH
jgi:hypothetical protein